MRNLALWFIVLAVFGVLLSLSTSAEEFNAGYAAMGKSTYRVYCASCHGLKAKGDGSIAEYLTVPPADLTLISSRNDGEFPAEMVYKVIDGREKVRGHGSADMPVWGEVFLESRETPDAEAVKQRITELVHFIQSIQVTE